MCATTRGQKRAYNETCFVIKVPRELSAWVRAEGFQFVLGFKIQDWGLGFRDSGFRFRFSSSRFDFYLEGGALKVHAESTITRRTASTRRLTGYSKVDILLQLSSRLIDYSKADIVIFGAKTSLVSPNWRDRISC